MYQLKQTDVFARWLSRLRDNTGKARIIARLDACRLGNLGDTRPVGGGVREIRIHSGPGYRVYYTKRQRAILLLLCGGRKSSQARDIARAKALLHELET